jgi:alpha-tubulin suppressor-like RCC1 family protein
VCVFPLPGNEHTVVLTRTGEVYTAGYNDNGQCGVGTTQRVSQLTMVEKLQGKGAVQVHAYNGCEHTLVVLQDGRLVSFGYNYRGQVEKTHG